MSTQPTSPARTPPQEQPAEPEEEARPSHTAEIGTLKKLSIPGGTAWLGSSSGVYFVNTVRRAFSAAFATNSNNTDDSSDREAVPASEDIITGEDATGQSFDGAANTATTNRNAWWLPDTDFHERVIAAVGRPPEDQNVAMELVTTFFRTTHPLFPFLHGPKFLEDCNEIYAAMAQPTTQTSNQATSKSSTTNIRAKRNPTSDAPKLGNLSSIDPLKLITFQIIINIAGLSHDTTPIPVPSLPTTSTIPTPQALLSLVLPLSTTPLIPTIQLLLSTELYLLTTNSLRLSSTVAGVVLRLIYHCGLHRCPLRYASLTAQDCEIRKRVFWSAYALDRHLSLALGDPNTFQDSDIDVCLSRGGEGEGEMHRAVARDLLTEEEREGEMRLHWPRDGEGRRVLLVDEGGQKVPKRVGSVGTSTPSSSNNVTARGKQTRDTPSHPSTPSQQRTNSNTPKPNTPPAPQYPNRTSSTNSSNSTRIKSLREAPLTAYVAYGKLTGRIIEIFHKSINFRFPKDDAIAFLSADIETWWNELPGTLTGDVTASTGDKPSEVPEEVLKQHTTLTPFFTLLYHQLLLLLNRPRLSLSQSSAAFQTGLQTCIRASRATLSSLRAHRRNGQSMFLPGLLSATWMSGLIIAFACQLGKYERERAVGDMNGCLEVLGGMEANGGGGKGKGNFTVRNCGKVLRLLVADIVARGQGTGQRAVSLNSRLSEVGVGGRANVGVATAAGVKRTRDSYSVDGNVSEAGPSPKRDMDKERRTESPAAGVSPVASDHGPRRSRRRSLASRERNTVKSNLYKTAAMPSSSSSTPSSTHAIFEQNADTIQQQIPNQTGREMTTTNLLPTESSMTSNTAFDFPDLPPSPAFRRMNFSNNDMSNTTTTPISMDAMSIPQQSGAALYADPQDIAYTQSNHSIGLPDMSTSSLDDQMFWGNIDSNLFDVFGAVSWENMTGPVGPMASNSNVWDMPGFTNPSGGGGTDGNIPGGGGFM